MCVTCVTRVQAAPRVCRCDTLFMKMRLGLALFVVASVAAQTTEEDFHVYKEYPRLILTPARLKLLRRERERQTPRWQQFDTLIQGKAVMPEPAFAYALYHQITGDPDAAKTRPRLPKMPEVLRWPMTGCLTSGSK